jgi:hypothetical protein
MSNKPKTFQVDLVMGANRSMYWIFESFDEFKRNPDQPLKTLFSKYVHNGQCTLINPGIVLALAYVYFVYPHQSILEQLDLSKLRFDSFNTEESLTNNDLLRHLRNSLAHSRYWIDEFGVFHFTDVSKNGRPNFSSTIHGAEFGHFVQDFGRLVVEQLR